MGTAFLIVTDEDSDASHRPSPQVVMLVTMGDSAQPSGSAFVFDERRFPASLCVCAHVKVVCAADLRWKLMNEQLENEAPPL